MSSAMACDSRYSGQMVLSVGVILFLVTSIFNSISSFAQKSPEGYISIDCGSHGSSTDPITNLLWVEDGQYETSGSNGQIQNRKALWDDYASCIKEFDNDFSLDYHDQCLWGGEAGHDNFQALRTFRYFSEEPMKSKYCYELPLTTTNISFLIRAMFVHGNASELQLPITFDVYVNASLWAEMVFLESDDLYRPRVQESIFFSPPGGNITYICLVPKQGVPFISSLELRQFDPADLMYMESFVVDNQELFFTKSARWNIGANTSALPTVRYPDDPYDRLWHALTYSPYYGYAYSIEVPNNWSQIGPEVNSVPSKVMESAWLLTGPTSDLVFQFDLPGTEPGTFVYSIFYFAGSSSTPLTQQMTLDNKAFPPFNITSQTLQQSYFHVLNYNLTITFSSPFVLNAMEVYVADATLQQTTDRNHVYVVNFIKETLNMTSWHGDPCTPVPYDWIECFLEDDGFLLKVNSLTLSHFKNVSGLTSTLFNNTAWAGEDGYRFYFEEMSITHSNVDSILFKSLFQNFFPLQQMSPDLLNMSFNNISELPDKQWWSIATLNSLPYYVGTADFSYNKFIEFPCFGNISYDESKSYFGGVSFLNISNNMITGPLPDTVCISGLSKLQGLILSNNFFSGELPASLTIRNLNYLNVLDISNNFFSGDFPYSLFSGHDFDVLSYPYRAGIQSLIADNNSLSGSLNLTLWYKRLQQTVKFYDSSKNNIFSSLFSFMNNKITSISPEADEFESSMHMNASILIQYFNNYSGGILLYGNPYCADAKTLFHRYLCRNSTHDKSYEMFFSTHKRSKVPFYAGIPGGVLLLAIICIVIITIVRLQKKVEVLQQFQQELLSRKVQPPFYPYHELKTATRDFNSNNKRSGAFGAVYKGVLIDKTTIAVKKLFVTGELSEHVLSDFLNEVVLLTGIKHRNLIQLLGCCLNNKERILVYEYVDQGNLATALWGHGVESKMYLDWHQRLNICIGVARGLSYLHEELQPRIIHRDIKALNILLDKNLNPKIAEFGLAKSFQDEETRVQFTAFAGTKGYFAPEYVMDGLLTEKADVYSFGILILEIVSGRKCVDPSEAPDREERVYLKYWAESLWKYGNILELLDPKLRGKCAEEEVQGVINIAFQCLNIEHKQRPKMSEVVVLLTAEMTSETLSLDPLDRKAALVQSKEKMMCFELEAMLKGEGSRKTGWISFAEEQAQTDRSEEVALVPSERLDTSDSY